MPKSFSVNVFPITALLFEYGWSQMPTSKFMICVFRTVTFVVAESYSILVHAAFSLKRVACAVNNYVVSLNQYGTGDVTGESVRGIIVS
jgi:hypothetical protein